MISICNKSSAIVLKLPSLCLLQSGWQAVCACRVVQGLAQGFTYPSIHHLIGKWIPVEEKSSLGTIIYAGTYLYFVLM